MAESIQLRKKILRRKMKMTCIEKNRVGVSDVSKFSCYYPGWGITRSAEDILAEISQRNKDRWSSKIPLDGFK